MYYGTCKIHNIIITIIIIMFWASSSNQVWHESFWISNFFILNKENSKIHGLGQLGWGFIKMKWFTDEELKVFSTFNFSSTPRIGHIFCKPFKWIIQFSCNALTKRCAHLLLALHWRFIIMLIITVSLIWPEDVDAYMAAVFSSNNAIHYTEIQALMMESKIRRRNSMIIRVHVAFDGWFLLWWWCR